MHGDVNELIKGWDVNMMACEVQNDSEGSNQVVKDRTIEFCNNVRATSVVQMMINGPRYLTCILQLSDFSMAVFQIKMRSLSLKLKSVTVPTCSCLKCMVALMMWAVYTSDASAVRCN